MPPQEQADLWMALRDRMKVDWNELTMQEKKAGMYAGYVTACDGGDDRGGENCGSAWRKLAAAARDLLFAPTLHPAPNNGRRVVCGRCMTRCADCFW